MDTTRFKITIMLVYAAAIAAGAAWGVMSRDRTPTLLSSTHTPTHSVNDQGSQEQRYNTILNDLRQRVDALAPPPTEPVRKPPPPPPAPKPDPTIDAELIGTTSGRQRRALVRTADGSMTWIRIGDYIDDALVTDINELAVTLNIGGHSIELRHEESPSP